ncbi:hypothetical protein EG328_010980 [Venturia inaequalis]|uniref:Uncharacterized protein n=1 Tax=Venturia inaequalis TaxID=5025 RepID=A0A8H3V6K2_VENIN|nr:hypothetical protein EG328_010980 [Venturia inaequalis]
MRRSQEHEYTPVDLNEDEFRCEKPRNWFSKSTGTTERKRWALWKVILLIEVLNVIALATGIGAWRMGKKWKDYYHGKQTHSNHFTSTSTDTFAYQLIAVLRMPYHHNTTSTFTVNKTDLHLALNTEEANFYWLNITRDHRNGLISLPLSLTKPLSLQGSGLATAPGESVFQVDMFHQLHCLERIRSDLLSAKWLYQLNPNRTDQDPSSKHTLHCVDYLRQAVMCNGDLTLVSTGVDLEFDHSPPRKCRDFGAVGAWVKQRMWEYERWTHMITVGGPFANLANGNHT